MRIGKRSIKNGKEHKRRNKRKGFE